MTGTLRPSDVCLTFDGNVHGQYEAALPVLDAFRLTAFWFADLSACDEWFDARTGEANLRTLHAAGHVIGLHAPVRAGAGHRLHVQPQPDELEAHADRLARTLGERPETISHAGEAHHRQTLGVLRGMGIRLGFTSGMQSNGGSELEYPRQDGANFLRALAA